MKKYALISLFSVLGMLLLGSRAGAQASGRGSKPLVYSKQTQEKMVQMRPHNTPLRGPAKDGLVLPKAVMEAMQNRSSLQSTPPLSEAEKKELLLNRIRLYTEARQKSAGG